MKSVSTVCGSFYVSSDTSDSIDEIEVFNRTVVEDQYGMRDYSATCSVTPKIVFDCGGHIGSFSYLAKSLWPDALIIFVEPNTDSMELAKKNLSRFGDGVVFVNGGIWYNETPPEYFLKNDFEKACSKFILEESMPYRDKQLKNMYHSLTTDPYLHEEHGIELYTLEELVEYFKIDHIDILKLDIEGAEIELFKNSTLTSDDVSVIVGEFHALNMGYGFNLCVDRFRETFSDHDVVFLGKEYINKEIEPNFFASRK